MLDVAGGTGDISFRMLESIRNSPVVSKEKPEIIVSDINPSMLRVGRDRAEALGYTAPTAPCKLSWLEANAEQLPVRLP